MKPMMMAALALALAGSASAAPVMTLVHSAASSGTIPQGTTGYSLDLTLDSGGYSVSGIWAQLQAPSGLSYSAFPLTMLNSPFGEDDVSLSPAAGDAVDGSSVMLFKATEGDYPSLVPQAILRLQMDPSLLTPGTYTLTPVGLELTNVDATIVSFDTPGSFTLTVAAVPEPGVLGLGAFAGLLLARYRPNAGSRKDRGAEG